MTNLRTDSENIIIEHRSYYDDNDGLPFRRAIISCAQARWWGRLHCFFLSILCFQEFSSGQNYSTCFPSGRRACSGRSSEVPFWRFQLDRRAWFRAAGRFQEGRLPQEGWLCSDKVICPQRTQKIANRRAFAFLKRLVLLLTAYLFRHLPTTSSWWSVDRTLMLGCLYAFSFADLKNKMPRKHPTVRASSEIVFGEVPSVKMFCL